MDDTQEPAGEAPLPVQGSHDSPAEIPSDFFPLRLVLQPGGHAVELTRPEAVVGRHSRADVRLPLPDVSRRHCRLAFLDGCWQLFDLNSLNGTHVNGQAVEHVVLRDGDRIHIGGFRFEVRLRATPATLPLPFRPAAGEEVLHRIASALPSEDGPPVRRAS
jgi:pSer/pThr/pTyr-binding forkhead associated (FHA) protein